MIMITPRTHDITIKMCYNPEEQILICHISYKGVSNQVANLKAYHNIFKRIVTKSPQNIDTDAHLFMQLAKMIVDKAGGSLCF